MRIALTTLPLACFSAMAASAADAKAGQALYEKSCQVLSRSGWDCEPGHRRDDDIKKVISDGKGKMRPGQFGLRPWGKRCCRLHPKSKEVAAVVREPTANKMLIGRSYLLNRNFHKAGRP